MQSVQFTPLFELPVIAIIFAPIFIFVLIGLILRRRGSLLRLFVSLTFLLTFLNPGLVDETREPLTNTVAILLDNSQSQKLGQRADESAEAAQKLMALIREQDGLEPRLITLPPAKSDNPQTLVFSTLRENLSDIPASRLSGVIIISDGQVHDIPQSQNDLGLNAPINALISGRPDEFDRKATFIEPPRFGIVKKPLTLKIMVEDQRKGVSGQPIAAELRINGEVDQTVSLLAGQEKEIEITLPHTGENIIELSTPVIKGELTGQNNNAVISVNGIRQNLRVLLISGEPHNGERVWRDLLKSDTSVDLIHFTILRLAERSDNTPEHELSLIVFPTTELFYEKLNNFDLLIFDRYQDYSVMPRIYYDFMAQYVKQGGALLMATGPEFAGDASLANTSLESVIPVKPTGRVLEQAYRPTLTPEGNRHPVTRGLSENPDQWGKWLRQIDIEKPDKDSSVLLKGINDKPLMLLSHSGKGRVGMLLSDEGWLWARGFDGGGPYAALYRRMAHWLMNEPELEEEALTASANSNTINIRRQTMKEHPEQVKITTPEGETIELALNKQQEGVFTGTFTSEDFGLFTIEQDGKKTLAYLGPVHAPEYEDMISTPDKLQNIAKKTGGNVIRMHHTSNDTMALPSISVTTQTAASNVFALRPATESRLIASHITPLFSGLLALATLLLLIAATWYSEGK